MSVKPMMPTTSGNQPPWAIFVRLAPRKQSSTARNTAQIAPAFSPLQPHNRRAAKYSNSVVMIIVSTTAMP